MAKWAIQNFGGEIPLADERLLGDNLASEAWNCEVQTGILDGLPRLELVHDMSAAPGDVKRAYRIPGPEPTDPDAWLPLPSPYSSVVPSPLTNDSWHRIYWTNPDGGGAHWSTYDRVRNGDPPYALGFLPVEPYWVPVVDAAGGSRPSMQATSSSLVVPGGLCVPGQVRTVAGGTVLYPGGETKITVDHTLVASIAIHAVGSGGTDGTVVLTGTTGIGQFFQVEGVISGGSLVALGALRFKGDYTANPNDLSNEPVTGGGLVGATMWLVMGAASVYISYAGDYIALPPNPAAVQIAPGDPTWQTAVSLGFTQNAAPPMVARSYLFTYVNIYNEESSPSIPSAVVEGPTDATWTVYGISNIPPTDYANKGFPPVNRVRIYRTITGTSQGAQFYRITDITIPPGVDPQVGWIDTSTDAEIVNNPVLESASWVSPPPNLDGLIYLGSGMMVGFTGNTVHFCEPYRPHTWPAGYDQNTNYRIVALAAWQTTLVILTQGLPSTGTGNSPSNFLLTQVNVPEPCIARGSVIADILGVYYSSPNGLIMLSYYGMQNQTASLVSRKKWLVDYRGGQLIAVRHRTQYVALNTVGEGLLIDFGDLARRGLIRLNTFAQATSIWTDIYSSDALVMVNKRIYRWDSPNTPAFSFQWRSKRWVLPQPIELGACQVFLDPSVETPPSGANPDFGIPASANAVLRLFTNESELVHEEVLDKRRDVFRFPSGLKSHEWQIEIASRVPLFKVEIASTMKELSGV